MVRISSKNRRKNYFIKKEFQAKFIMKFCVLVVFAALISSGLIYRFASDSVTTVFDQSRLKIIPSAQFIMPALIYGSLLSVILIGLATIIIVLFISHRIAGPLYKIEDSLIKMGGGDLSFYVDLRSGDEIGKLAEVYNETSRRLNTSLEAIRDGIKDLNGMMVEIKVYREKEKFKEMSSAIAEIEKINKKLLDDINRFKLRVK